MASGDEETIRIISIDRVNRNGKYFNRVVFQKNDINLSHYFVYEPFKNKEDLEERYKGYIQADVYKDDPKIRHRNVRKKSVKKVKGKGFYLSFIKMFVIVRYKNNTPFWFPKRGRWNTLTRMKNLTEDQMLKSILSPSEYSQFQMWVKRSKKDSKVYIYNGWTYKRVFSRTGSFNGDSQYLDYYQRIFQGNNGVRTINKLRKYRYTNNVNPLTLE